MYKYHTVSKKILGDIIRILGTYHSKNDLEKINETLKSDLILMMNFYKFLKKFIQRKKVKMI